MKIRFTPPKPNQAVDTNRGIAVPYASSKRFVQQWRWKLIVMITITPFAYLAWKMLAPVFLLTAPGFIYVEKDVLTAPVPSVIAEVHVRVGEYVQQGAPLLTLHSNELDQKIRNTRAELGEISLKSDEMCDMATAQEAAMNLLSRQVEKARLGVSRQQERWQIIRRLHSLGAATAAELNAASIQLDTAHSALIKAQLDAQTAQNDYQGSSKNALHIRLKKRQEELFVQLYRYETEQAALIVAAPRDGAVLALPATKGQMLQAGQDAAVLGYATPHVLAYARPEIIRHIRPGNQATVSLPNGPSLTATVREFPTQSRRLPVDLSSPIAVRDIMVLVNLDFISPPPPERAIDGLPVEIRFHRFTSNF